MTLHTIESQIVPVCVLVLGASGSGKGHCIGSILTEYHGVYIFVTGDWCRQHATEHAADGILVDDNLINSTVATHFDAHPDPFYGVDAPRSVAQAAFFLKMFRRRHSQGRIIAMHVETTYEQSFALIRHRAQRQGRKDDATPAAVEKRLSTFFCKDGVRDTVIPFVRDQVDTFIPIVHKGFEDPLNASDADIDECVEATRMDVMRRIAPEYFARPTVVAENSGARVAP